MMHFTVTALTLVSLLLHAALGCSAPHAHAGEAVALGSSADVAAHRHAPGTCRHHQIHAPAEDDREHRPDHHGCDDLTCSYLAPVKVQLPQGDLCLWSGLAAVDAALGDPARDAWNAHGEVPVDRGRASAMPLHALHCIWIV